MTLDAFNELLKAIYKAGKFEDATFRLLYVIKTLLSG